MGEITLQSKLPQVGTTIFSIMSALAARHGALNLSQGFPDFDAPLALRESLAKQVMDGHNQYAPMAGVPALREQIAAQLLRYRSVSCNPESEITVVPGATEAIFCAITACIHSGDEVIVFDPCYDSYEPAITLAGATAIHLPLSPERFCIDWNRVQSAISPRCRMIIINSPHNPSGSTLAHEDLVELERLAEKHNLLVVSDEVYEHLVFDNAQHHSVLQYPALRARSFAIYSFGKTFSVTGWKTGYCVAPPRLTAELRKVHQFVTFVAVTPIQLAIAEFMKIEPAYSGTLAAFYQSKRDLFCTALERSRFKLTPSAGTYFQVLDYSAISTDRDTKLAEHWTCEHKLASIPMSVFYAQPPLQTQLRFCFAKNDAVLLKAADILCKL
ncbi:MAG: methionine aminotransferase [Halioglobus sp.]|jgi:methionine aminotransferase